MLLLFISSSLQSPAMYQVQMPHMTVSQSKPYRPGKGEKNHISSHFSFTSINLQIHFGLENGQILAEFKPVENVAVLAASVGSRRYAC